MSENFAYVVDSMLETIILYNRVCRSFTLPCIIVVSDNQVSDDCDDYVMIDEKMLFMRENNIDIPSCYFVSSKNNNHFSYHYNNIEFESAEVGMLQQRMIELADKIINTVRVSNNLS